MDKRYLMMGAAIMLPMMYCGCAAGLDESIYASLAKAGQEWPARSDYEHGKRYLEIGDYGLAIDAFNAEVSRNPKSIQALNGLAIAFERLGRVEIAENYFRKALELDNNNSLTLNNFAYLKLSHGDAKGALALAERAKTSLHAETAGDATSAVVLHTLENNELLMHDAASAPPQPAVAAVTPEQNAKSAVSTTAPATGEKTVAAITPDANAAPAVTAVAAAAPKASAVVKVAEPGSNRWELDIAKVAAPAVSINRSPTTGAAKLGDESVLPVVWTSKLKISNGSGRSRMARNLKAYFVSKGVRVSKLTNANEFGRRRTVLYYRKDMRDAAETIVRTLPIAVKMVEFRRPAAEMELVTGSDLDSFSDRIASAKFFTNQTARL
jgi:hypothetical protein